MVPATAHMSCLDCGHRWETEARQGSDSVYVIVDDLCPKCGAQGDPLSVSASRPDTRPTQRVHL